MTKRYSIPLESNPEHAQAIGIVIGYWGFIETLLPFLLSKLLGVNADRGQTIFNAIYGHRAQRRLLESVVERYWAERPEAERLKDILGRVENASTTRNRIVHDIWAGSDEENALSLLPRNLQKLGPNKPKTYTPEQLNEFTDELGEIAADLMDIMFPVDGPGLDLRNETVIE